MANISKPRPRDRSGLIDGGKAPWGLSPSDFAFVWGDCPLCFYLKLARKRTRPSSPFPSVFARTDRAMKDFYLGERAEDMPLGMPGVICGGVRWLESASLPPPGVRAPALSGPGPTCSSTVMTGPKASWTSRPRSPKPITSPPTVASFTPYATPLDHLSSGRRRRSARSGSSPSRPTPQGRIREGETVRKGPVG